MNTETNTNTAETTNTNASVANMEAPMDTVSNPVTETVTAKINPIQAEIERRLEQDRVLRCAQVKAEFYGPKAKKLLQKKLTVAELMRALDGEDVEFTEFVFANAETVYAPLDVAAPAQHNGSSRKAATVDASQPPATLVTEAALFAALSASPEPLTIGALAKAVNSMPDTIRPNLKALVEAQRVTQSGEKRATVYCVSATQPATSVEVAQAQSEPAFVETPVAATSSELSAEEPF